MKIHRLARGRDLSNIDPELVARLLPQTGPEPLIYYVDPDGDEKIDCIKTATGTYYLLSDGSIRRSRQSRIRIGHHERCEPGRPARVFIFIITAQLRASPLPAAAEGVLREFEEC